MLLIFYETKENSDGNLLCSTLCPFGVVSDEGKVHVGSLICGECDNNASSMQNKIFCIKDEE